MKKNHIIILVAIAIIAGGGGFWGGMSYGQSTMSTGTGRSGQGGNFGGRAGGAQGARFAGGNGAFGSIIAKDATSITVKLGGPNASSTNGSSVGSRIVLYDNSTEVGKFVSGSLSDLSIGENVSVSGTSNTDGSITARMIQIRPAGMQRGAQ